MVMKLQIFMIKKPKVDSNYTCLTVISFDSALRKDENYYPQMFLKECIYIEKKVIRHINDNFSDFFFQMSLIKNVCFFINSQGYTKGLFLLRSYIILGYDFE